MEKEEVFESIKKVFEIEGVGLSDRLIDDLGFDSLDLLDVTMKIEDDLNIQVSLDDIEKWFVVEDVVETFHRLLNEK